MQFLAVGGGTIPKIEGSDYTLLLSVFAISFLALGVKPPTATWGNIVHDGNGVLATAEWVATFPGLCIVLAVVCFNLVGDALRDALDPRLRT